MNPLISVIMPVKNGEKYIREALDSLRKQPFNLEIIVVDDGSSDHTAAIAAEYGCKVLSHPESKGPVIAKNTGLKVATGDYIMFMDHDDRMREGTLQILYSTLADHPEVAAAEAMVQDFPSPECNPARMVIRPEPYYGLFTAAILIRKSAFDKIGLFPTDSVTGEIFIWSDRMDQNQLIIKKINWISTDRRIHEKNFGRTRRNDEFKDYAAILRARLKRSK